MMKQKNSSGKLNQVDVNNEVENPFPEYEH